MSTMSSTILVLFAGSKRNYSTLTLDGVDVMGERLAEEVFHHFQN